MSALLLFSGVLMLAAPDGFGSADGKVRAKTPVARPVKRSGPKKETLNRKAKEDERRALVISSLELAEGAKVPDGADYAQLIEKILRPSKVLRLVYAKDCFDLECMRKAAASEQTSHLVFASMSNDRRITLLLNELPGRGLLRQRTTPPLEASDLFEAELTTALTSLLGLGGATEGTFEPDAQSAPEPVEGEDVAALAKRRQMIQYSTYTVYAGAGLFGLGMTVGTLAAINASQWRDTSYRFEDGAYREQIRGIAQTRAVVADLLLVTGMLASGAGYYTQRKAVAGPFGKMTMGWGQDTWREPEATEDAAQEAEPNADTDSKSPDFVEDEPNEGAQP
jgi:hypothetical protein